MCVSAMPPAPMNPTRNGLLTCDFLSRNGGDMLRVHAARANRSGVVVFGYDLPGNVSHPRPPGPGARGVRTGGVRGGIPDVPVVAPPRAIVRGADRAEPLADRRL